MKIPSWSPDGISVGLLLIIGGLLLLLIVVSFWAALAVFAIVLGNNIMCVQLQKNEPLNPTRESSM